TAFFRSERAMKLRAEGRVKERAQTILQVFEQRGLAVPDPVRERLMSCQDLETLRVWFNRSLTVTKADDLFAESDG
ncbi:hypothetical protein ACFWZ5_43470, partial [Streptomyces sp. NPDC059003]